MKRLAALVLIFIGIHASAVEVPAAASIQGTWRSQVRDSSSERPELQLLVVGTSITFTFEPQVSPAAWIRCHKSGTFPAKLLAETETELSLSVTIDTSSQFCGAVTVECVRNSPNVLACSWVGRQRYSLHRIASK